MKSINGIDLPEDFYKVLTSQPDALRVFEMMPPSHQKEYANHIEEAKKEETRQNRIKKSIEMILEYGKTKRWIP